MRVPPVVGLARYAAANNLRTPHTWVGLGLLAGTALLGMYASARQGLGWIADPDYLTAGGYVAALFVLRSGIVAQRRGGLQTFLRSNFVSAAEHLAGAVLGLLAAWLLVGLAVLSLGALLPGMGLRLAAWTAWTLLLWLGMLLPFVLLTEILSTIEVPLLVPGLLWLVVFMAVYTIAGLEGIQRLLPGALPGSFASTGRLTIQAATVMAAGFGVILAWTAATRRT